MKIMNMTLRKPGHRGFTLLELAVATAMIGALGIAVFVAKIRGKRNDTVIRASAGEVLRACELARNQAMSLKQVYRIRLDRPGHRLVIEPQSGESLGLDLSCRLETNVFMEIYGCVESSCRGPADLPEQLEAGPGSDTIHFFPDGSADSRSIRLLDWNGTEFIVRVSSKDQRLAGIRALGE